MSESHQEQLDLTVAELLRQVAAPTPAPGAGAVTATVVALAAGLTAMSAGLSGRQLPEAEQLAGQAVELQGRAAQLGRRDAEAYAEVLAAQSRSRDDSGRAEAVYAALQAASDVPLEMARIGAAVVELAESVADRGNPSLEGDARTAALLARAAVRAAVMLVQLNLKRHPEDPRLVEATLLLGRTPPGSDLEGEPD